MNRTHRSSRTERPQYCFGFRNAWTRRCKRLGETFLLRKASHPKSPIRSRTPLLVLLFTFLLQISNATAVSLTWDPSNDGTVTGYRLYLGTLTRVYTGSYDLRGATSCVLSGLVGGTTYYFAVTAYNSAGLESVYSGEVSFLAPSTNPPPSIFLTSPSFGAGFSSPATINLAATVIANGHSLTKVQFCNGASVLKEVFSAPYSYLWSSVPAGSFGLSAKLVYDAGSSVSSSISPIIVTNSLPSITLVAPLSGATFAYPGPINLAASIVANGHAVTKVQFYSGANLLGQASSIPYSLTWTNVTLGVLPLSARLVFDSTNMVSSAPVSVSVIGLPVPWQSADIGAVGLMGSAGYDTASGTFTVKGAGADIWGTADAFRFAWQPVNGDCEIRARVNSFEAANGWAKAGVMIREALTANSAQVAMLLTLTNAACFEYRSSTGANCGVTHGASYFTPYWVRLVRSGNTFTGHVSPDGSTWLQIGNPVTVTMGANVYLGLCDCACSTTTLSSSKFSNVYVSP